jgi:N-acetyl-gamma-glutamylphosphate reductase
MKKLMIVLILSFLTSCANKQPVRTVTEYAILPDTYKRPPLIHVMPKQDIPLQDYITEAVAARLKYCQLYTYYKEAVRTTTFGLTVIDDLIQGEHCPDCSTPECKAQMAEYLQRLNMEPNP